MEGQGQGHKSNNGRPTSLALKSPTDGSPFKMDGGRASKVSPGADVDLKSPSKSFLSRSGPPPGFGTIPNIRISPASSHCSSAGGRTPDFSFGSRASESSSSFNTPSPNELDRHEIVRRRIAALLDGYAKAKKLELSILGLVEASFPGEKLHIFLDTLARQILCEASMQNGHRIAAVLVRAMIKRGSIQESEVFETISNGVIKDLGNLLVLPQGTGELAGFLTDLFLTEPDLKWLLTLTNKLPREAPICTELVHGVVESLKLRVPLAEVQNRIQKTLQHGWQ